MSKIVVHKNLGPSVAVNHQCMKLLEVRILFDPDIEVSRESVQKSN